MKRNNCRGSALISAFGLIAILMVMVAGIVTYLNHGAAMDYRSHDWNQAMHLAESAVEIGLAELNWYHASGTGFQTARGWTNTGAGIYQKSIGGYTNFDDQVVGSMLVVVSGTTSDNPQILGTGTPSNTPSGPSISRSVSVVLGKSMGFQMPYLGVKKVVMHGDKNDYIDSYDSSDPAKSTDGLYDPAKRQANATVAALKEKVDGKTDIFGNIQVAPGVDVHLQDDTTVGTTLDEDERAETVAEGVAKGYIRYDLSMDVPAVVLPDALKTAYFEKKVEASRSLSAGDYHIEEIIMEKNDTLTIEGNVRLYVKKVEIKETGKIVISPGAKLEVYFTDKAKLEGDGVHNETDLAANNQWKGLPGADEVKVKSNIKKNGPGWVGTVYAPDANLNLNVDDALLAETGDVGSVIGAFVAKEIHAKHSRLHYDEALGFGRGSKGYTVLGWREL